MMDGFEDPEVYQEVRDQMCEVGHMLSKKHRIDYQELAEYIEFALARYLSSKNTDYVARVCRNPIRKLNPKDRLAGPAIQAATLGMPFGNITRAIAAAFMFDAKEDEESQEIQGSIKERGIEAAITQYTSIEKGTALFEAILDHYQSFQK